MRARIEIVPLAELLLILADAAAGLIDFPQQLFLAQAVQRANDRRLVVLDDRIAAGRLVAGIDQCVQRKRIVFRRGGFFLNERSQYPAFHFTQDKVHGQKSYNSGDVGRG